MVNAAGPLRDLRRARARGRADRGRALRRRRRRAGGPPPPARAPRVDRAPRRPGRAARRGARLHARRPRGGVGRGAPVRRASRTARSCGPSPRRGSPRTARSTRSRSSYVFDDLALSAGQPARAVRGRVRQAAWSGAAIAGSRAARASGGASTRAPRSAASATRSATPGGEVVTVPRHIAASYVGTYVSTTRSAGASRALGLLARALPLVPRAASELLAPYAAPDTDYARTQFAVVAQARRGFAAAQVVVRGRDVYRTTAVITAWCARQLASRMVGRDRHARARRAVPRRARAARARRSSRASRSSRVSAERQERRSRDGIRAGRFTVGGLRLAQAWYQRSMTMSWQLEAEAPAGRGTTARRYRLANGLGLITAIDRRAPIVALQTWFRVGSRHERPGATGMAHLFEHLMFGQTESLPPGEFDRLVERTGGESNAATWVDWTYYRLSLPARDLPLGDPARGRAHAAPRARDRAGRVRARRRHQRAPRARRGRRRRLARRAADGARVHGPPVPLADDRLDGGHPRAVAARDPRVLPDLVRAEQRDDRVRRRLRRARAARSDRESLRRDPVGAAPRAVAGHRARADPRARRPRAQADRDRSAARRLQGARPGRARLGRARDRRDAARRLPVGAAVSPARDRARGRLVASTRS